MESTAVSLIHVVMPTYNREKTLAISVESIIKQTHENWQLVIVDDSSTDNSAAVINELVERDKRISTKKILNILIVVQVLDYLA
jgi:glycosyltransferase involved in cell wall biosynthesis